MEEKVFRFVSAVISTLGLLLLLSHTGSVLAKDALERHLRASPIKTTQARVNKIEILKMLPHDPQAFTQGLVFDKGFLYESTGLFGKSALLKKDVKSGKILKRLNLPSVYFGEGIALLEGKIYQLTYQSEIGFIYDLNTFSQIGHFKYAGEGWGLTTNGKYLIMSNGSSVITFHEPDSFSMMRKIRVHDGDHFIDGLNELEFIKGEIWANIFAKNIIARISPETGIVLGWIDMNALFEYIPPDNHIDVLNGIAFDRNSDRIFVTGKFWPAIFEIKILPETSYPSGKNTKPTLR